MLSQGMPAVEVLRMVTLGSWSIVLQQHWLEETGMLDHCS